MKRHLYLSAIILSLIFFLLVLTAQTCAEKILYVPEEPEVPEKAEEVSQEQERRDLEELSIEKDLSKEEASKEITKEENKSSKEEKAGVKDVKEENTGNIKDIITISGPIEDGGTISLEINLLINMVNGYVYFSSNPSALGEVFASIDPATGVITGGVAGSYDTEVGVVPYVLTMDGKLNKECNYAEGTLTNEDGEVFGWNATKVSQ